MEIPTILNPTMADAVIASIREGLTENLPWLDAAFGRAERIVKQINGRNLYLPAIYTGNSKDPNEYLELSPDSQIGNFCFFWMLDPQRLTWRPKIQGTFRDPFALIFWFDLRRIYGEKDNRNIMALEEEILSVLNGGFRIPFGHISVDKVYHLAENIYREFSLFQVDNQFLMHPYAGFRLEGELVYDEACYPQPIPVPSPTTWQINWNYGDAFATRRIYRIRGNSQIIEGVLRNNITNNLKITGPNLFNPNDITMEGVWTGGPAGGFTHIRPDVNRFSSNPLDVKPGQKFYVNKPQDMIGIIAFAGNGSYGEYTLSHIDGVFDCATTMGARNAIQQTFWLMRDQYEMRKQICLNLSHPDLDGRFFPYREEILQLSIPSLVGRRGGVYETIFPTGLKSCGSIYDEIQGTTAIKRVGSRDYQEGDEDEPTFLTDGVTTNYPLIREIKFAITPLPDILKISLMGYIRRFPEENNTDLIIDYYDI